MRTKTITNKDTNELAKIASRYFDKEVMRCLSHKAPLNLALCGGNSIIKLFEALAMSEASYWRDLNIFMLDERLVPPDSELSNYRQARDLLLQKLINQGILPLENVYPPLAMDGDLEDQALQYATKLDKCGGVIDIAIMAAGEDGHIASLFPQHPSIRAKGRSFFGVTDSPKPPPQRLSASIELLQKVAVGFCFFVGKNKTMAYNNFNNDKLTIEECPAKIITQMERGYIFSDLTVENNYENNAF